MVYVRDNAIAIRFELERLLGDYLVSICSPGSGEFSCLLFIPLRPLLLPVHFIRPRTSWHFDGDTGEYTVNIEDVF